MTEQAFLKSYLKILADMETHRYLQQSTLKTMREELRQLRTPLPEEAPPTPERETAPAAAGVFLVLLGLLISAAAAFAAILAVFLLLMIISLGGNLFDPETMEPLLYLTGGAVFVGGTGWSLYKAINNASAAKEEKERHLRELREYRERQDANRNLEQSNRETAGRLSQEIAVLERQAASTQRNLDALYAKGIIYAKYRNLVAICSICEYFLAGRCSSLGDAYNLFETEQRANLIITKLDEAVSRLGELQRSQYMLQQELTLANEKRETLLREVRGLSDSAQRLSRQTEETNRRINEIGSSSAAAAYSAERTREELDFMNRMNQAAGIYRSY